MKFLPNFSGSREMSGKATIIVALLIVLLLTQTRFMRFFFNTVLGRLSLILVLLALTYFQKMWGFYFAAVLVLAVSLSGFKLIEPMENMPTTTSIEEKVKELKAESMPTDPVPASTPSSSATHDCLDVLREGDTTNPDWQMCVEQASSIKDKVDINDRAAMKDKIAEKIQEKQASAIVPEAESATTDNSPTENNMATEGFDTMGLERQIQLGKSSNMIPLQNRRIQGDDFNILPNDLISFLGFSPF
jgi:hypothetical protein